ncbi:MAG: helix-turn-helix transcriptional regulator [Clostridia bacterium]|nr:helix-turn-helix transcriptional regulator [Clostridia bacterium]
MIVYDRLWRMMEQKGITAYRLREECNIDRKTVRRLKANENIETKTLDRICKALSCRVEDIMEYIEE